MTTHTGRDEAWDHIFSRILAGASLTPADVSHETAVSERTARDVLVTMRDMGWLEEREQYSLPNTYEAGERVPQTLFTP